MNLTAESVTDGHPDKVADYIADSILDAYLEQDAFARVACEVLCKNNTVVLAGEITSSAQVDHSAVVRDALREIDCDDPENPFNADSINVIECLSEQGEEIRQGLTRKGRELGAGDQGIIIGFATDETPELMPLPILLAHRLTRRLAEDRREQCVPWLQPDGKVQISVAYEEGRPVIVRDVVVSVQHAASVDRERVCKHIKTILLPDGLGSWMDKFTLIHVNPSGSFIHGGPAVDCGLTGRKNIMDTYGPSIPHGGGSFSGKDPTKVDRSAAYFCRFVARHAVRAGVARRILIRVAYAIGEPQPVTIDVETFGTGVQAEAMEFVRQYDFQPEAMIDQLGLRRPIYRSTTNHGHFGRPGLPWEM